MTMTPNDTPTPLTDAVIHKSYDETGRINTAAVCLHARTLERSLHAAKAQLAEAERGRAIIRLYEQRLDDARRDRDRAEADRDALRARCEELEIKLKEEGVRADFADLAEERMRERCERAEGVLRELNHDLEILGFCHAGADKPLSKIRAFLADQKP